ncbi:MAG: sulfatase-like hydrolase/transferase [Polyangiaceae bacterium]
MGDLVLMAASTLLLACAVGGAYFGARNRPKAAVLGVLVFAFFVLTSMFVAADRFTGNGIDQAVLYHVTYGFEGADVAEYSGLIAGVAILLLAGGAMAFALATFLSRPRNPTTRVANGWVTLPVAALACGLNPASRDLVQLSGAVSPLAARGSASQSDFATYYRTPELGSSEPKPPRNFVFIYAEGLERTYFDESIFPGLIVGLRELEAVGTSFTEISQTAGTSFTIGGMVGSQCGIPLVTASSGNSMSGMASFLPEAVCLGDLLRARGYHLSYLGGASLNFAGKGKFLSGHGFTDLQGREELLPLQPDPTYRSGWGLHDDTLLDVAYDKFSKLSASGESFGLFLLTLDTHPPDGHIARTVKDVEYEGGDNAMLNAVARSDRLLSAFIQRVRESPQGASTVIVLVSDHLALANGASARLARGTRRNLFLILDPLDSKPVKIDKRGSTLDIGPTVLHALGYRAKLGLGRDLLSDEASLIEQHPDFKAALSEWRRELSGFWGMSRLTGIKVSSSEGVIELGGTTMRMPALITFDAQLNAEVLFEFHTPKRLLDHVYELELGAPFVWIAGCDAVRNYVEGLDGADDDTCVVAGRRGAVPTLSGVASPELEVTESQLTHVLGARADERHYAEQSTRLADSQLPKGLLELLASIPEGSVLFQPPKDRTSGYVEAALKRPDLADKGIVLSRSLPDVPEFYFCSSGLKQVKQSGRYRVRQLVYDESLLSFLKRNEASITILSAKDEAKAKLSPETVRYFSELGVELDSLKVRGSFAAVLDARVVIAQGIDNKGPVVLESEALAQRGIDRVESAGLKAGNYSRIVLKQKNVSKNRRGLNIVILPRNGGRLVTSVDTHVSEQMPSEVYNARRRGDVPLP